MLLSLEQHDGETNRELLSIHRFFSVSTGVVCVTLALVVFLFSLQVYFRVCTHISVESSRVSPLHPLSLPAKVTNRFIVCPLKILPGEIGFINRFSW